MTFYEKWEQKVDFARFVNLTEEIRPGKKLKIERKFLFLPQGFNICESKVKGPMVREN